MTLDTEQAELVTGATEDFKQLIAGTKHVLFDFDGPICRLFAGHSADAVARDQVEWLERQGLVGLLTEDERRHPDPHGVLSRVAGRHPRSDLVTELEELLTQQELKAVPTAWPTEFADPLIRTWKAVGVRLAIVTNNSRRTVKAYLDSRDLEDCFGPNIYGRTKDLDLLKPHPHTLKQAMRALGASPATTLMIGDAPSDHAAAKSAEVRFLGYAGNDAAAEDLLEAGVAPWSIARSLETVLETVRGHA